MDDLLKLDKQLCFSVYVLHREIMQCYRPILKKYWVDLSAIHHNDDTLGKG